MRWEQCRLKRGVVLKVPPPSPDRGGVPFYPSLAINWGMLILSCNIRNHCFFTHVEGEFEQNLIARNPCIPMTGMQNGLIAWDIIANFNFYDTTPIVAKRNRMLGGLFFARIFFVPNPVIPTDSK